MPIFTWKKRKKLAVVRGRDGGERTRWKQISKKSSGEAFRVGTKKENMLQKKVKPI